jgi:toxin YoeB
VKIVFAEQAWEDYLFWQAKDRKKLLRINALIEAISREPFGGIGKPEALRFQWTGWWSRRIDDEHRLVYKVVEGEIWIGQCRYHY